MEPLVSSATALQLDSQVQATGVSEEWLVETAGARVWGELKKLLPPDTRKILFVAGAGDNGADALVAARHAWAEGFCGIEVWVPELPLKPLTQKLAAVLRAWKVPVSTGSELEELATRAEAVVEGLVGTGRLKDSLKRAWDLLSRCSAPLYAIDLPAGTSEGSPLSCAATLTFLPLKKELFLPAVRLSAGTLVPIFLPWEPEEVEKVRRSATHFLADFDDMNLRRWKGSDHKGTRGRVGIVAGGEGMLGAGAMAASAASVPAGVVEWVVPAGCGAAAGAMVLGPIIWDSLSQESFLERVRKWDALLLGSGMEPDIAKQYVGQVWDEPVPLVLDAGALSLDALQKPRKTGGVATPHPGELARLLGWDTAKVVSHPEEALEAAASPWATVLLKTQPLWIRYPDGKYHVVDAPNPGLGFGGSGDLLSGLLAGLCASQSPWEAALAAVILHQRAGAKHQGKIWPSPRSLLAAVRKVYGEYQNG